MHHERKKEKKKKKKKVRTDTDPREVVRNKRVERGTRPNKISEFTKHVIPMHDKRRTQRCEQCVSFQAGPSISFRDIKLESVPRKNA